MKTESGLVVALGVVGVVITNGYQVFFFVGGDENIVNLDCSELDYEYTKTHLILYFILVNFMLCGFYLNKYILRTKKKKKSLRADERQRGHIGWPPRPSSS